MPCDSIPMVWQTFLADLVVAAFGAVMAAVLTVAIAAWTVHVDRKRTEQAALNDLVRFLSTRRAFEEASGDLCDVNATTKDRERVAKSVLRTRDEIASVRSHSRAIPSVQEPLTVSILACNAYLEKADLSPEHYVQHLMELRQALTKQVHVLRQVHPSLDSADPGTMTRM